MKSTRKTMLLQLLCIYIALQLKGITSIKVRTISHTLPFPTKIFQDSRERSSPRLVYGVCENSNERSDRNCTLVIETDAARDLKDHLHFCDITIKSRTLPMKAVKYIYALDNNTAVIQWTNSYSMGRFAIVHFSDCRLVYPKVSDDSKISLDLIRAPYNGTFDVIIQDNRKGSTCISDKWCRMIFDVNGNVLEQPRNWIDEQNDIIEVVHTDDGRRLVIDMNYNQSDSYVRVYKAYDNGMIKVFGEYPAGFLRAASNKIAVSSTHQLLTICALNVTNMTCGQFDQNGILKLETNFKPLAFPNLHSAKVFNLPNGGFLLLTINCSNREYVNECQSIDDQFFTIRILDPLTKILKSLTITQLKCDSSDEFNLDNIHYVENANKTICMSYVCDHRLKDSRVSVEVNCFTKTDLNGIPMRKGTSWRKYR